MTWPTILLRIHSRYVLGAADALVPTRRQTRRRAGLVLTAFAVTLGVSEADADVVDDLQPGEWVEVPNTSLASSVWDDQPPDGFSGLMRAWSGGAFDTRGNRLLIFGGGHADYSGNEIYAFEVDTLSWALLTTPSSAVANAETYGDGSPASRHTYEGLEYVPELDALWVSNGSRWSNGYCVSATWTYDLSEAPALEGWQARAPSPGDSKCGAASAYDSVTGLIWFSGKGGLASYDPLTHDWTVHNDEDNTPLYVSMTLDPVRRLLVMVGSGNAFVHDLTSAFPIERKALDATDGAVIEGQGAPGLVYDSQSQRVVAWSGGADVYSLDLDARAWRVHPPAASNSITPTEVSAQGGTFGRFQYVPERNVFIAVNATSENVYFYRLSEGPGQAPRLPPLVDPDLGEGGSGSISPTDAGDGATADGEPSPASSPRDAGTLPTGRDPSDASVPPPDTSRAGTPDDSARTESACSCRIGVRSRDVGTLWFSLLVLVSTRRPSIQWSAVVRMLKRSLQSGPT